LSVADTKAWEKQQFKVSNFCRLRLKQQTDNMPLFRTSIYLKMVASFRTVVGV
jgi:hypothetical protein